jgi:uncharacterized protein (DUF302 family)
MTYIKSFILIGCIGMFSSCAISNSQETTDAAEVPLNVTQKVDNTVSKLNEEISSFKLITSLDHHRMAAEVGVYTPPSIATIFSDIKIDIALIESNQLIGLDLPFKVLCYAESDTLDALIAYTSAEFIQKRHNTNPAILKDYTGQMEKVLKVFPDEMISKTDVSNVDEGFGVISIPSDFDFATTVTRLREIIMSQGDTKWFADIDYQMEAKTLGTEVRPTTLLLFGAPGPGGKAMITSPKIGLDAFCQKLLVYENANGDILVAYNDIVAFATLYYNTSTKPQQMINQRLKMVFTKAVSKPIKE